MIDFEKFKNYLDTTGKSIRKLYTWFESNIGVDKWDDFYNYLTLR